MKSNYFEYDYLESIDRIDDIVGVSGISFEALDYIPSRSRLTFMNGFYVNCSALFVDIRESTKLTEKHYRPTLAKLYRAYISEIVAIINGNESCKEINIVGDCVSGIFDTPTKIDRDGVFETAVQIRTLIKILNCKFKEKEIKKIRVGIGLSYGRALMIKAGYSGTKINDVVWLGDVVNEASKLSDRDEDEIIVTPSFYKSLNDEYKKYLYSWFFEDLYSSKEYDDGMYKWYKENCKKRSWW